ncbi:MAG: ABC transporter permease [Candidatus Delongbacteria bacterium]|nr:ABC transporter permease [Candidatus Delongbacteria bacterium]
MHFPTIRLVAAKEILELLRDRRTLISTILVPVLAMPLLIGGMVLVARNQINKLQTETIPLVVRQLESAPGVASLLEQTPRLEQTPDPDPALPADSLIARGLATLVLECDSSLATAFVELRQSGAQDAPAVHLYYNSTKDEAQLAARELVAGLEHLRSGQLSGWLAEEGISERALEPWVIRQYDVATEERRKSEMIARFLPYLILVLVVQSLAYPAMELTAGEKERHTIETLLVNPVSRVDLVLGKFTAISALGMGSAVVTLGSQLGFLMYLNSRIDLIGQASFSLSPFAALVALLFLLPFTLFFAALMLMVSLYARSMKEAQSYVAPMMMLVIFPSMMSMIPGLELNWATALVPVYNVTLMLKQVLVQNWAMLPTMGLVFLANAVYAVIAIGVAVHLFSRESIIFRS